ncbi:MAG: PH domain-containing protein [Phycisphaerales bacterium JB038]
MMRSTTSSPAALRASPARKPRRASTVACREEGTATLSSEAAPAAEEIAATSLPLRVLDEGEVVILNLRPHPLYIVLQPLGTLAALVILTAVAYWIISLGPSSAGGMPLLGLGGLLVLARLGWSYLEWFNRIYVLTDRRVIRRKGVLRVSVFQAPLRRIQHLTLYFSIRERAFQLGTVGFSTAGTGIPEAYWIMVAKPVEVHRIIQETIDKYSGAAPPGGDAKAR